MLLKRLIVHGFKTFATRTVFEFPGGVTAVIGPNGSGKSNLADAVRWVLGETSQAALRARRGEDVIFVGSGARPAMGMAEVSLTLDNADRMLDSDFAEIEITRRAFRDGETQYLINGARVRLKDVQELTAPLGGAYTVVGQGLVDAALSQRPEDRRGLFEHAAGISAHQLKRGEAERRLAAAEANCQRLTDILAELGPRVRALERQARLAGEAAALQARFEAALRLHHGRLWRAAAADLAQAVAAAETLVAGRPAHQAAIDRLAGEQAAARADTAARQAALEAARRERARLARDLSEAVRQAAVAAERVAAIRRRQQDEAAARAALEGRRRRLAEAMATAARSEPDLETAWQQAHAEAEASGAALADRERALHAAAAEARALNATLLEGTARAGRVETSLARANERLAQIDQTERRAAAEAERRAARRAALLSEGAGLAAALQAGRDEIGRLDARRADLLASQATLEATLAAMRPRLASLERDLTGAQARLEALTRLRESGAGLAGGPKAVLAAARRGQVGGVVGMVASLVQAPAHLDTALEVALGGHVQDLVVECWADAEAAIELLKQSGAGRATFLPLDSLRPGRAQAPPMGAGIVGVAAALVQHEARLAPVVQALLGRVLVVEDLATARRVTAGGGGWTTVTLAGEIARPGGALTGGAAVREAGVLGREREWRALPARVAALTDEHQRLADGLAAARAERAAVGQQITDLTTERARQEHDLDRLRHAERRLNDDLAGLEATSAGASQQQAASADARAALADEIARQQALLEATEADLATARAAQAALTRRQADLAAGRERAARASADARAALARLEERRRAGRARLAELRAEQERLAADERAADERAEAARRELERTEAAHQAQAAAHGRLARALAEVDERAAPIEAALAAGQVTATEIERRLEAARGAARAHEVAIGQAEVMVERRRGDQAALAARIEADLPGCDPSTLPPAEMGEDQSALIATLRERLRRLGPIDPAVIDEHAAQRDRHAFLTGELADVEAAIRALRAAIAELDGLMRQRFGETFQRVNAAFGQTFGRLFTGGTARLVLTDEGNEPGVEIIAQPPGKRPQALALLSGGERALTAVALLFAILEVNPSPFRVLDEVDAALDESNVVRFGAVLADLAARTQFIVITHNRGTIEGADTLYGISMGRDGISRVISLRLDPPTGRPAIGPARAADD